MKRHLLILLVIVLTASMVLIVVGFKKADETTSMAASSGIEFGSDSDDSLNTTIDLSSAILLLSDLPEEFSTMSNDELSQMEALVSGLSLGLAEATLQNLTGYRTSDVSNLQFVVSCLISPLTDTEQNMIDNQLTDPEIRDEFNRALGGGEITQLIGAETIGNTRMAFSTEVYSMQLDYVVARRGPVLIEVAFLYPDSQQPLITAVELATILDERVIDVVGTGITAEKPTAFRPAGPLVPEITTYIPTPLNLSPKPTVIGTNLLLAALTMLLFAVAAELFTRTLTKNEEVLKRKMRPAVWLSRMQKRIEAIMGTKMGRHLIARDIAKLLGIILFYGLAFSLLDRTWKPFSLTGLVLFLNMTIAYGIVGIAGDIMQWRALKRWGVSTEIGIRPTNILISVISIATSRLVGIVPGLMFGTPQALRADESTLDKAKQNRLLKISAITLLVIGFGLWLPTIATSLIQRLSLPGTLVNLIGGFEGFLLIIFAVALENTFIQMLGFPGGFGRALKQKNRWLWFGGLVVITFIFYHTLINPRGELVEALQETNVILFMSVAVAFIIIAFGLWLYFRRKWQTES